MSKFVAGHVTKMCDLKLWIASFWTEILHLNFKEIVEKMSGNVYSTSERNYQTFNKIQAKCSFGRHGEGKSMPSSMADNTNHTTLLKNQSAIKYLP